VPTRKQKRRREKLQRHEYEYVIETETGEEVPIENPRDAERAKAGPEDRNKGATKGPVDRRGRPLQPPSWRRVLRRAAVFAPLIGVFIYLTMPADRRSLATILFNVVLLLAFFIPFSYVVDIFMYRMMSKRYERERAARRGNR
jgi:hypothetical protein